MRLTALFFVSPFFANQQSKAYSPFISLSSLFHSVPLKRSLPRLLGRATVEMVIRKPSSQAWTDTVSGKSLGREAKFRITLDGYSAPLTAGNFIDLCRNRYYSGNARVLSKEPSFFVHMGISESAFYKDPSSNKRRDIPMEILLEGDPAPLYGATLDELGVADLQPALPVTAYGAVAMEHSLDNANDSSANFYVFLLDPRSYSARALGGSILSGSMAAFGYITDGRELLPQLAPQDLLVSCTVVDGEQNFRQSAQN